jgi:RNA polymerase sigma-70 factor (ECF subfamily)
VAQEVCIRLVQRIASFRGDSRFSTWLYQLVLNACRDHKRRQGRVREMQQGFAAVQADDHADWADTDAKLRWLYLALDRLKPDLKETALLILAEDVTQDDAATILGISAGTVAWRMSEVKKRLRAMADNDDARI